MFRPIVWKFMSLVVDWSVRAEPLALSKLSHMTNTNAASIKQMYRAGDLGPAPDVAADVAQIPLYHAVAFFLVREAGKAGVPLQHLLDVLPAIAGAAYVQYLLTEIRAGHCVQRGGTPALNPQLWALLHRPEANKDLEQKLPGGAVETRRFACFNGSGTVLCDDLAELETTEAMAVIDAWSIPKLMKQSMPGTFLYTHIA
jgi:hypothetical protein